MASETPKALIIPTLAALALAASAALPARAVDTPATLSPAGGARAQGKERPAGAAPGSGAAERATPPPSGDEQPAAVTFPEAVARALDRNAALAAAAQAAASTRKEAEAARGRYLPSLVLEERFIRTNVPAEAFALKLNQSEFTAADFTIANLNDPAPRNDFTTALTLEQPLFAPKAWLGSRTAGREAEAAGLDLARAKEDTVFRVLAAFLDVLSARERVLVADQGLSDAREHLRTAEAAEGAGTGLLSDVLRSRVFLARAESARVTAVSRLAMARTALGLAMGEKGGARVDALSPAPELPEAGSLEERIAAVAERRADVKAVSVRRANAGTNVTLEKSDYLPTVGAFGAWQADAEDSPFSPDNRSWKVGVGLSWILFDGLRREAAVGKAAAEERRARELLRGAGDQAAFEVTRAHLAVGEAEGRLAIARTALAAAEEGTRLVKARYESQRARMIDLLDAQTALDAARADLVGSENDLLHARAALEYASGTLLEWALGKQEPAKGKGTAR